MHDPTSEIFHVLSWFNAELPPVFIEEGHIIVTGTSGDSSSSSSIERPDIPIVACAAMTGTTENALDFAFEASPLFQSLFNGAIDNGTRIVVDDYGAAEIGYNTDSDRIQWNPFLAFQTTNSDGSSAISTPLQTLIHEVVHAAVSGDPNLPESDSEELAIALTNIISAQINANAEPDTPYDTSRDTHGGAFSTFAVASPLSSTFDLGNASGGC